MLCLHSFCVKRMHHVILCCTGQVRYHVKFLKGFRYDKNKAMLLMRKLPFEDTDLS